MGPEVRVHERAKGNLWITKIDDWEYQASSGPGCKSHRIVYTLGRFQCECKGFAFTNRACKHIAGVKHTFGSPPPPPEKGRRKRKRRRKIIGTPDVRCSHCMSKNYKEAYVRPNLLRDAQVYTCLAKKCGRNFTHDDGFKYKTYTGEQITTSLSDRACGKMPHDIADTVGKCGRRPSPSTMFGWCSDYPRLVAPYLASLDYQLSETMLTDEIVVKIGGVEHVIFTTMCEGTRAPTGYQIGRKKGSHDVRELFRMDILVRGGVPSMVRSDGAQNFASAHKSEMRENDEGKKSMHIRHIHLAGDRNPNTKERDNGTIQYFVRSCRGLKRVDTAYIALYQIHFLIARLHSGVGTTPLEAAGISFKDPDKWRALINNAAAYNNVVKHGKIKPCRDIPDGQAGFQVVPISTR